MTWLAYFIAGVSTTGFVSIWFMTSAKDLSHAKKDVEGALQQLQLQEDAYPQVQNGPYEKTAYHSLEIARLIVQETQKGYEQTRHKFMNRIPAFVLGYRPLRDWGKDHLNDLLL